MRLWLWCLPPIFYHQTEPLFSFAVLQVPGVHEAAALHSRGHATSPQEDLQRALRLQTVWLFKSRQSHIDLRTCRLVSGWWTQQVGMDFTARQRNPKFWSGKAGNSQYMSLSKHSCWFSHWKGLLEFFLQVAFTSSLDTAVQICLFPSALNLKFNEGCDSFSENKVAVQKQMRKSSAMEKLFTGNHKISSVWIFFLNLF